MITRSLFLPLPASRLPPPTSHLPPPTSHLSASTSQLPINMARDNFSRSVIEILFKRAGGRCSDQSCRVPTMAPSGKNAVTNVGVAAHICAASPGGPRYKAEMSKEDRCGLGNGIWLCQICATKIDSDLEAYPTDLLFAWKAEAESKAWLEVGKKMPDRELPSSVESHATQRFDTSQIETVLLQLYPMGPTHSEIWSRAGGDVSILIASGNGRAAWHAALRTLALGGGGKDISLYSLIKAAIDEYPRNPGLVALQRGRQSG